MEQNKLKLHEIEAILQHMVGKNFTYLHETHRIIRFEIKETTVKIVTDLKDIVILMSDVSDTLNLFEQVNVPQTPLSGVAIVKSQTVVGGVGNELKNILMDTIKKVQKDKDFIPQANAVIESTKALIDLAKVEVEMLKVVALANKAQ